MFIIGSDEVGLGAWAGPLVVGAALVPEGWTVEGLADSKTLKKGRSMKRLTEVYNRIMESRPFIQTFVEWVWPEDIDRIGIRKAQLHAFRQAVLAARRVQPEARIVIDGGIRLFGIEHETFPKADAKVEAVMAASIVAKIERDRYMQTDVDSTYPKYGFINHVGYGTPEHIAALDKYGPTPMHRMSVEPVFTRSGVIAT